MDIVAESVRPPLNDLELETPVRVIDAPMGELARTIVNAMAPEPSDEEDDQHGKSKIKEVMKLSEASRKQYILHWVVPRPGVESRPQPQRMYAEVEANGDFHLCGAFSTDLTFQ